LTPVLLLLFNLQEPLATRLTPSETSTSAPQLPPPLHADAEEQQQQQQEAAVQQQQEKQQEPTVQQQQERQQQEEGPARPSTLLTERETSN
jgi:hypothetical protein